VEHHEFFFELHLENQWRISSKRLAPTSKNVLGLFVVCSGIGNLSKDQETAGKRMFGAGSCQDVREKTSENKKVCITQ